MKLIDWHIFGNRVNELNQPKTIVFSLCDQCLKKESISVQYSFEMHGFNVIVFGRLHHQINNLFNKLIICVCLHFY